MGKFYLGVPLGSVGISRWQTALMDDLWLRLFLLCLLDEIRPCYFQMGSQYQRSVPLEVRRAEGERVRAKHPDKIPVGTSLGLFCPFQMFKFIPKSAIWLKLWDFPFVFLPLILYFLCRLWTTIFFICFFTDHRGASCEVTSSRSGQKEISGALRLNRWKHGR